MVDASEDRRQGTMRPENQIRGLLSRLEKLYPSQLLDDPEASTEALLIITGIMDGLRWVLGEPGIWESGEYN